jgi:putative transposase
VVQDDAHLLVVLRYIEANPLRARMVTDLGDYRWSSYPCHGLGRDDPLLSPFPEWEELGSTERERRRRWRAQVYAPQQEAELSHLRRCLQSGRPFGSPEWTEQIAERLHIDLSPRPRGRPRKSE